MDTIGSNRRLRQLLTDIANNKLIPRPDFQRRLVWTNKEKLSFIRTVLSEFPFPEIYVAAGDVNTDTGEGTELLVDGQQRLTTLYQYFKGSPELRLSPDLTPYTLLDTENKRAFLEYQVVVRDLGQMDIDSIKRIFLQINSTSYSLNALEMLNARYDGNFKKFAELIAADNFFERHGVFGSLDIRRMLDVRYCLTIIITMMSTYFNRDDELEPYLERYNEEFNNQSDLENQLQGTLLAIEACHFESNSRVWKKVDLFTLIIELHKIFFKHNKPIDIPDISNRLKLFYTHVDSGSEKEAVAMYRKATIQATNDRSSRISRGEIIQSILNGKLSL